MIWNKLLKKAGYIIYNWNKKTYRKEQGFFLLNKKSWAPYLFVYIFIYIKINIHSIIYTFSIRLDKTSFRISLIGGTGHGGPSSLRNPPLFTLSTILKIKDIVIIRLIYVCFSKASVIILTLRSQKTQYMFWKWSKSGPTSRACSSWWLQNLKNCHSILLLRVKFATKWVFVEVLNLRTKLYRDIWSLKRCKKKLCQFRS